MDGFIEVCAAAVKREMREQRERVHMNKDDEILRSLGRIEGRLIGIEKLFERVRKLEMWQSWLKGAWGALVGAWFYLYRQAAGK